MALVLSGGEAPTSRLKRGQRKGGFCRRPWSTGRAGSHSKCDFDDGS